jgi:hypothetical protein
MDPLMAVLLHLPATMEMVNHENCDGAVNGLYALIFALGFVTGGVVTSMIVAMLVLRALFSDDVPAYKPHAKPPIGD